MKTWMINRRLVARFLIGGVIFFNVQAAILFLVNPNSYAPAFQITGIPGKVMVQAMGLLFLMWNVPYVVAFWQPVRYRVSLYEAIAMQAIGLAGESLLLVSLPDGYLEIRETAIRFIQFDGVGLLALVLAAWVTRQTVLSPPKI